MSRLSFYLNEETKTVYARDLEDKGHIYTVRLDGDGYGPTVERHLVQKEVCELMQFMSQCIESGTSFGEHADEVVKLNQDWIWN